MAALAAPYDAHKKDGKLVAYPMAANTTIFKGALVGLVAGFLVTASDTAGLIFVGVAHETKANQASTILPGGAGVAGAAGALSLRVEKEGTFSYNKAAAVAADRGKQAFISDDNTVSTAATTNNVACGYVTELLDGSHVQLRINRSIQ